MSRLVPMYRVEGDDVLGLRSRIRLVPMYRFEGADVLCIIRRCVMVGAAYGGLLPVVIPQ